MVSKCLRLSRPSECGYTSFSFSTWNHYSSRVFAKTVCSAYAVGRRKRLTKRTSKKLVVSTMSRHRAGNRSARNTLAQLSIDRRPFVVVGQVANYYTRELRVYSTNTNIYIIVLYRIITVSKSYWKSISTIWTALHERKNIWPRFLTTRFV